MHLRRCCIRVDATATDPAIIWAASRPGIWCIEIAHQPPVDHDPALLLPGSNYVGGLALSLGCRSALQAQLAPSLIARLAAIGVTTIPLAGIGLHELVVNAVVHGNLGVASGRSQLWCDLAARQADLDSALAGSDRAARCVTIALGWTAALLEIVVADEGDGYQPDPSGAFRRGSNRGLLLVSRLGRIAVEHGGRRTRLFLAAQLLDADAR